MEKTKGIVVFQGQDISKIKQEDGSIIKGRVSGKFRQQVLQPSDYPVVGDEVLGYLADENQMIIEAITPRKSFLQRKVAGNRQDEQGIAANVSTVFITTSANQDFNLSRLERFTTIVWDSGATPVLVLTKTDLVSESELEVLVKELETYFYGISVCVTNCFTPVNEDLKSYLKKGDIIAFIGSSGVGKSTLLNQLLEDDIQATKEIREDDARGKHTTTSRHLFTLPNGAMVIDTPGMREIGLGTMSSMAFDHQYQVIYDLAKSCRFSDCRHQSEPGCQVKEAIETGNLAEHVFKSYLKMERELAFLKAKEERKNRKTR
ncbi:ribosome small subunit-dependent GTPase A [Vagococcus silagei]|uniref:Small ribosomal subunit biogenesis GTPase RsgA n=1 Tax=Vagococcus silagei TaxID=2508885 RepID=A0A4S3B3P5_9ENTE|nr:ribosome small subunit-dependent GTPase A [Vagococcus silagei]THB60193.1 ribosome small subunit-dependent GTPase A [Vagococcus silagei]